MGILYRPLPASTAIHSIIFVGSPHMKALYTQSPPPRLRLASQINMYAVAKM